MAVVTTFENEYSFPAAWLLQTFADQKHRAFGADYNMNTQTPTVIYRTRFHANAMGLADYLSSRDFDARLAVENPHGYFGELPVTDFVHEVMATNFDAEKLKCAVLEWERLQRDLKLAAAKPYCYHCGLPVMESAVSCVNCGKSLDLID